eukprot:TRINITY_DN26311_c0_g2_i1.p1 TRINITY_DN26311_c0_g2~~TRINITY_DN26311_c0_g2_i1.p1  ORF type:complete len:214 (-),score=48.18 TRINITY_DN26311_c0_g2_i1:83-724(-)
MGETQSTACGNCACDRQSPASVGNVESLYASSSKWPAASGSVAVPRAVQGAADKAKARDGDSAELQGRSRQKLAADGTNEPHALKAGGKKARPASAEDVDDVLAAGAGAGHDVVTIVLLLDRNQVSAGAAQPQMGTRLLQRGSGLLLVAAISADGLVDLANRRNCDAGTPCLNVGDCIVFVNGAMVSYVSAIGAVNPHAAAARTWRHSRSWWK